MSEATLAGIHHVTINVHDVDKSEQWYGEVLGFVRLAEFNRETFRRVIMVHPQSGAVLGVNRHMSPEGDEPFSERRTGLDHVALRVPDRASLDAWVERFKTLDVVHSEVKEAGMPGAFVVTFRDPDNIQLEIFAPPVA